MSSYVLNTDGSIIGSFVSNKIDNTATVDLSTFISKNFATKKNEFEANNSVILEVPSNLLYISTVETLGDFKSGKNFAETDHTVFKDFNNFDVLPDNFDIKNPGKFFKDTAGKINNIDLQKLKENAFSKSQPIIPGVINKSKKLYSNAHGESMNFGDAATQEEVSFYTPYNSFFDLDLNYSGRADNETGLEIFADEAEMLYGVPHLLHDPDKFIGDLGNVFTSLTDMLVGAIIPITAMSVLQGLLQVAQQGPPDPFALFGTIKTGKTSGLGNFITYVKIDPVYNPILSTIFNPIIEGLISLLKTTERLMNFPANQLQSRNFILEIGRVLIKNTICFCLGYIYYLIPGFKIDSKVFSTSATAILTSLFSIVTSLTNINKSKHNYNLLIRKIAKNNYFRRRIQFKAKEITDKNGNIYNYDDQIWYQLSDFFHRFVGERLIVGQKVFDSLYASEWNKRNKLFAIQKMNELPVNDTSDSSNTGVPLSLGSSILGTADPAEEQEISSDHFNKSIYSINSLVSKTSNANNYMEYHNSLIKQNEAIYQKKQKRLSKEHVQKLEALIDSDYMPFSIQDLRTNEIFKFHAFVENYGDTFNVGWDEAATGFGRMDSVKTYKGTSRSISVDFWLVAMSPDDFDYMWWMINRLIALVYPQWSAPKPANVENQLRTGVFFKEQGKFRGTPFAQPFTQIPTGSPVIRLRLGDIFTSNYSKKGLARMFGFDLRDLNINPETEAEKNINFFDAKLKIFNSDVVKNKFIQKNAAENQLAGRDYNPTLNLIGYQTVSEGDLETYLSAGGAVFPWNELDQLDFESYDENAEFKFSTNNQDILKTFKGVTLTDNYNSFYWSDEEKIDLDDINSPSEGESDIPFPEDFKTAIKNIKKLIYIPTIINEDNKKRCLILLYEIILPPIKNTNIHNTVLSKMANILSDVILNVLISGGQIKTNNVYRSKNLQAFMSADGRKYMDTFGDPQLPLLEDNDYKGVVNNPIVKSFESTMGEGLAGTIQGFTIAFDQQIPWELDKGSRAPIAVKIGLQMSVIHDILPGLDDQGIMRAPTYRVGKINNEFFGNSVYNDIPDNISYNNAPPINPNAGNQTDSILEQPPNLPIF